MTTTNQHLYCSKSWGERQERFSFEGPLETPFQNRFGRKRKKRPFWADWKESWEGGCYLDYMQHYHYDGEVPIRDWDIDGYRKSGRRYFRETRQVEGREEVRMRLLGTGPRDLSPIEGTYYWDTLAADAMRVVEGLVREVEERHGVNLQTWGEAWIMTIGKRDSWALDDDLFEESSRWRERLAKLFSGAWECIRKAFKRKYPDVELAAVAGVDFSGEEAPWEPHYHLNFYVLPLGRTKDGRWVPLERWKEQEVLAEVRKLWKEKLEKIFGHEIEGEVNIKRRYLKTEAQMRHFVRYLFRHPLEDFWKGFKGFSKVTELVTYLVNDKRQKRKVLIKVPGRTALVALKRVRFVPKNWTRIRWFGFLSCGKRGRILEPLGFSKTTVSDEGQNSGWVRGGVYEVVSYHEKYWVFRPVDISGPDIIVPVDQIDLRPAGVIGKRTIWKPPGERQ